MPDDNLLQKKSELLTSFIKKIPEQEKALQGADFATINRLQEEKSVIIKMMMEVDGKLSAIKADQTSIVSLLQEAERLETRFMQELTIEKNKLASASSSLTKSKGIIKQYLETGKR